MTALLTDADIEKAAGRYWDENDEATSDDMEHYGEGARFARSFYESRLTEDAKREANWKALVESLEQSLARVLYSDNEVDDDTGEPLVKEPSKKWTERCSEQRELRTALAAAMEEK